MSKEVLVTLKNPQEISANLPQNGEAEAEFNSEVLNTLRAQGFDIFSFAITLTTGAIVISLVVGASSIGLPLVAAGLIAGAIAVAAAGLYGVYYTRLEFLDVERNRIAAAEELTRNYYNNQILNNPSLSAEDKKVLVTENNTQWEQYRQYLIEQGETPPAGAFTLSDDLKNILVIGGVGIAAIVGLSLIPRN